MLLNINKHYAPYNYYVYKKEGIIGVYPHADWFKELNVYFKEI